MPIRLMWKWSMNIVSHFLISYFTILIFNCFSTLVYLSATFSPCTQCTWLPTQCLCKSPSIVIRNTFWKYIYIWLYENVHVHTWYIYICWCVYVCILNKQIKLQLQVAFGLGQFTMVLHANFCQCVCVCHMKFGILIPSGRGMWHTWQRCEMTSFRVRVFSLFLPFLLSLSLSLFHSSVHLCLFIIRLKYSTWRRLLQHFLGADKNLKEFSSQFFSLTEWQGHKFYSLKCG